MDSMRVASSRKDSATVEGRENTYGYGSLHSHWPHGGSERPSAPQRCVNKP